MPVACTTTSQYGDFEYSIYWQRLSIQDEWSGGCRTPGTGPHEGTRSVVSGTVAAEPLEVSFSTVPEVSLVNNTTSGTHSGYCTDHPEIASRVTYGELGYQCGKELFNRVVFYHSGHHLDAVLCILDSVFHYLHSPGISHGLYGGA